MKSELPASYLAAMLQSLELAREDELPDLAALRATYNPGPASSAFWDAILADITLGDARPRSRPGKTIELYQDAVVRHARSGAIAFSELQADGGFRHLSYAELDSRATACAAGWSLDGLEPGDVVALAMPVGMSWLIALAAAWRLGLAVSCLGQQGEDALCRRLRALAPKGIVFDPEGPKPPLEFAALSLTVGPSSRAHVPPPWAYAPDQPIAKLFSPVRAPVDEPVPLPAEKAFLSALRDARFAYRLGPNGGLSLPGFCLEQHQPAAILASLLSGCRFVELPMSTLTRTPSLLAQPFLTSLGVAPQLRDLLRGAPVGPMATLQHWWRSVDEPLDWPAWQDFVRKQALRQLPVGNLLVDAASGGALLISASRPGGINALVVPAPGSAFVLTAVASSATSSTAVGVFSLGIKPDPKNAGWFLLAKRGPEYLYGSTLRPRRAARVFSEQEVVECVIGHLGIDGACVVPVATGDPATVWSFVLVLFGGALEEVAFEGMRREARRVLSERLGTAFVPDQIEVFPLHARSNDRKLDLEWCSRQYSAGLLQRKAGQDVFRRLTALRACLKE